MDAWINWYNYGCFDYLTDDVTGIELIIHTCVGPLVE
jgi:hypothetical protein